MNKTSSTIQVNRRELLRTAGRVACLGGLAILSGVLIERRYRLGDYPDCRPLGACERCSSLSRCTLPAAVALKKTRSYHGP